MIAAIIPSNDSQYCVYYHKFIVQENECNYKMFPLFYKLTGLIVIQFGVN